MSSLDKVAGIAFITCGGLLTAWGSFSILGTVLGGVMSVASIVEGDEELLIGIPVFLIYGFWMVICLLEGPLQILVGARLLMGKKGKLTWVATMGSLLAASTVYCALPAMLAFGLGLAAMLTPDEPKPEPA